MVTTKIITNLPIKIKNACFRIFTNLWTILQITNYLMVLVDLFIGLVIYSACDYSTKNSWIPSIL